MKVHLKRWLIVWAFCPSVVSAGQCSPGEGAIRNVGVETDFRKVHEESRRTLGSVDINLLIEAKSKVQLSELQSRQDLSRSRLVAILEGAREVGAVTVGAIRVDGGKGRTTCVIFEKDEIEFNSPEAIHFMEGDSSENPKVCISEEGTVVSTLKVGLSHAAWKETTSALSNLEVTLFAPDRETGDYKRLIHASAGGCKG